jgi:hypothetical protein
MMFGLSTGVSSKTSSLTEIVTGTTGSNWYDWQLIATTSSGSRRFIRAPLKVREVSVSDHSRRKAYMRPKFSESRWFVDAPVSSVLTSKSRGPAQALKFGDRLCVASV